MKKELEYIKIEESYISEELGEEGYEAETPVYWNNGDFIIIKTTVNTKLPFRYFKYIRNYDDINLKRGDICRIRLDKPEYVYNKGDAILTKAEKTKLIQILNSTRTFNTESNKPMWDCIILEDWMNHLCYGGDQNKPIIPPMPDYNLLPTSD